MLNFFHSATRLAVIWIAALPASAQTSPPLNQLLRTLLEQSSREDVLFREVITAVTGKQILPVEPQDPNAQIIVQAITDAIEDAFVTLNRPDSPTHRERRINEVSSHFEQAFSLYLDRLPDFQCARPLTQKGTTQSSGYPDLLIHHLPSGRFAYLDPKLVEEDSLHSSFRTFYYTPRVTTSKVLEDAHHLIVGIKHDGKVGKWKFTGWELVDLYAFQVRLKAEYQASNRDLYQPGLILRSGTLNR